MKRGEWEKEKKRKRKRRRREEEEFKKDSKVWNLDFWYRTTKFEYGSLVLYGIILPKPRVC